MNSAALDNELFVRGRFVTLRRAAALVAAVLVLAICWNVVGVRLSTVFRASTADALWTFCADFFLRIFRLDSCALYLGRCSQRWLPQLLEHFFRS